MVTAFYYRRPVTGQLHKNSSGSSPLPPDRCTVSLLQIAERLHVRISLEPSGNHHVLLLPSSVTVADERKGETNNHNSSPFYLTVPKE